MEQGRELQSKRICEVGSTEERKKSARQQAVLTGRTAQRKKSYINKSEVRNKDVLTVAVRDANRFTVLGEARPSYLQ